MSAAKPIPVSESLLRSLEKPVRNPELMQDYLSGRGETRLARSAVARTSMRYGGGRFIRPRPQRSPDREKSIRRRRTLAATWPMPPAMAGMLTTSQVAYARIVADEVGRMGDCRLTLDEIAARGGMCRKTAKRAQDRLSELGWITVTERPVQGRKHLSNIVCVVSSEWAAWITMGPKPLRRIGRIGGHWSPTTENQSYSLNNPVPQDGLAMALEGKKRPRAAPILKNRGRAHASCP